MRTISTRIGLTFAITVVVLLGTSLLYYSNVVSGLDRYRQALKVNFQEVELAIIVEDQIERVYEEWNQHLDQPEYVEKLLNLSVQDTNRLRHFQQEHGDFQEARLAERAVKDLETFLGHFRVLIGAWQARGGHERQGLHLEMRTAAHELERLLRDFDTAPLLGILGQMRASEAGLAWPARQPSLDEFQHHRKRFLQLLSRSTLAESTRERIRGLLQPYLDVVAAQGVGYPESRNAETKTQETERRKEMNRAFQSIHDLLQGLFLPNALYEHLQSRRHEKDFLARLGEFYVQQMHESNERVRAEVRGSGIDPVDQGRIIAQANQYEKLFLKIVDQERTIAQKTAEIRSLEKSSKDLIHTIAQRIRKRMDFSLGEMGQDLENAILMGLFYSILVFVASLYLVKNFASKTISAPLEALREATVAIGLGQLDTSIPILNDDEIGAVAEALRGMARDLAVKTQALEASHLYNENILASITDTLIVMTPEGEIERYNRSNLLGYDQQELIGVAIDRVITDLSSGVERRFLPFLTRMGWVASVESVLTRKDGRRIPVLVSSSAMLDGSKTVQKVILMVKDITEIKEINASLEHARREAEAANQAKSLFVANMSHEIRTPMNAVLGMTHLCLQTSTTSQQRDYLEKIHSSAKGLLRVINEILDFSKIEAGKVEVESVAFHLDDVLRDLATQATMMAHRKAVEVIFMVARGVPRTLIGDPLRLGQVLINLTNNAVKFTESGEIVVSVELLEEAPASVTTLFKVKDTGIGMTPSQVRRLFQAFTQADNSMTRRYGGTGLGLTISKHLVELMGGEIKVNSQPGQGTTFQFSVRFGVPQQSVRRSLTTPDQAVGKRILVVDDNQTSREMLLGTLLSFSFNADAVASGPEGLARLQDATREGQPFDLLLIDWQMPERNGAEVLLQLHADGYHEHLTTILMSTLSDREQAKQQCGLVRPTNFVDKPVNISALFDVIMTAFGQEGFRSARPSSGMNQLTGLRISGARILLVEDNEINQQVAKELLEMAGISVVIAGHGRDAVQFVQESSFDLVLMDLQMPEMDGFEATRTIRQTLGSDQLPIIAMTADVMAGDITRCLEAGMNDHVGKPIDPHKLYVTLSLWIKPREGIAMVPSVGNGLPPLLEERAEQRSSAPPGINTEVGLARVGGNTALFQSSLRKFAENHAHALTEIRAASAGGDLKLAIRLAHTLKGVAGSIGANRLHGLARELETRLKSGDDRSAELFPVALVEELQGVVQAATRLQAPLVIKRQPAVAAADAPLQGDASPVAGDPVAWRQRLASLRPHLEKRRPKACTPILEEMAEMTAPPGMAQEIGTMIHRARNYQYRESLEVVDSLLARLDREVSHDPPA